MLLFRLLKEMVGALMKDVQFGKYWEFPKKMAWVFEKLLLFGLEDMKGEHNEEEEVVDCSWYRVVLISKWMLDC